MPKADRAYTSGPDSHTQVCRRPLTWNQVMDHATEARDALLDLLVDRGSVAQFRAVIRQVLREHIIPIAEADTRKHRSGAASIARAKRAPRPLPEHLRDLTDKQLDDYRFLLRKGYRREQALETVRAAKATVRPPTAAEMEAQPRGALHGLTQRQVDDRYALMRKGQHAVAAVIAEADRQANAEARL